MSRFVFDTNIIVSALLYNDSPPRMALIRALNQGTILSSAALVSELRDVLGRRRFDQYVSPAERNIFLRALIRGAELVTVTEPIQVCRDPKDDLILAVAVNGGAASIITGDNDLLVLNPFRNIPIMTPAEFLRSHL